jgi:hypothetical protein
VESLEYIYYKTYYTYFLSLLNVVFLPRNLENIKYQKIQASSLIHREIPIPIGYMANICEYILLYYAL